VAIIHRGRVQADGEPLELLRLYDQPNLEELFFFLVDRADGHKEKAIDLAARQL